MTQKALLIGNLQKSDTFHYAIYQQHPALISGVQKAKVILKDYLQGKFT
jgi:hypothetical protein